MCSLCALLCSCHHYTPKIRKKQQILNKFEKISNTFEHVCVYFDKATCYIKEAKPRNNDVTRTKGGARDAIYLQRVQKVNAEKAELTARLEELQAAEPERNIKRIPVLSKALDQYWALDSEDRNRLLKGMAERVEYEKTERGTGLNPRLRVTLRI